MNKNHIIKLKVAAVSKSANSFGLRGHVLVSRSGIAVEVGLNYLNGVSEGSIISIPVSKRDVATPEAFAYATSRKLSGEIPRPLKRAPREVAKEIWSN